MPATAGALRLSERPAATGDTAAGAGELDAAAATLVRDWPAPTPAQRALLAAILGDRLPADWASSTSSSVDAQAAAG